MQQKHFTPKSSYAISRRHLLDSRLFSFCDIFFLLLLNTQRTLLVASVVMTSHPNVFLPVGPSNTSHDSDANGTGVWWIQTLDVADSMVVICGTWFWKNSIEARHSVGCVPHWMKVCYIKNLEVNGGMVSATCINLPAALRCTEAALWMTSSRWKGLEEY